MFSTKSLQVLYCQNNKCVNSNSFLSLLKPAPRSIPHMSLPLRLHLPTKLFRHTLPRWQHYHRHQHTVPPSRRPPYRQPNEQSHLRTHPQTHLGTHTRNHDHQGGYQYFQNRERPGRSRRGMYWIGGIGGVMGVYYWSHLEVVESTGRRRFIDVTPAQEEMMARKAYQEVMLHNANHILPPTHPLVLRVSRIAARLIATTPLHSLPWSLHIISSPIPNAFILPGGQIFVFTGLLSLTPSDSDIAAVLSHEIAHQLARHSAEKLSYIKILIVLGTLLTAVFDPGMVITRLLLEYGLLRSGSRRMETEADYIGLEIMSRACFDPRAAIGVWQRMKLAEEKRGEAGNAKWMEYLSTHPSTERRIENLTEWMPDAEKLRIESGCEEISPMVDLFRSVRQGMW